MVPLQVHNPAGQLQGHLLDGELIEDAGQNLPDVVLVQLQAVDRHHRHLVFFFHLLAQLPAAGSPWLGAVEEDDKGLANLLELPNHPALRLLVLGPRDIADGAIGGNHQADGAVFGDDLFGANLRRHVKGNLPVKPGGHHHPRLLVFDVPQSAGDDISHAVDKPNLEGSGLIHRDLHRLLRDELRFGGHDGFAGSGLRQLVGSPLPPGLAFDVGQHQGLHKPLDKGGFSGAHRPHHPDINIPVGALCNVLV